MAHCTRNDFSPRALRNLAMCILSKSFIYTLIDQLILYYASSTHVADSKSLRILACLSQFWKVQAALLPRVITRAYPARDSGTGGADLAQRLYASNLCGQCVCFYPSAFGHPGTWLHIHVHIHSSVPGPLRSKTTPLGQVNHRPIFGYQSVLDPNISSDLLRPKSTAAIITKSSDGTSYNECIEGSLAERRMLAHAWNNLNLQRTGSNMGW